MVEAEAEVGLGPHGVCRQGLSEDVLSHCQAALTMHQKLRLENSAEAAKERMAKVASRRPTPTP